MDLEKIKSTALSYPEEARKLLVLNPERLIYVSEFASQMRRMRKAIAEAFDPIIRHARAEKKKYDDPLKEAEQIARMNITAYMDKQRTIQREAEEIARREEEKRQKEEDRILEESRILKDSGKIKESENIIAEIPLPARTPEPPPLAPEGLSTKRIVDTEAIDRKVLMTSGTIKIPGIETYVVWKWRITDRKLIPDTYYKTTIAQRDAKDSS